MISTRTSFNGSENNNLLNSQETLIEDQKSPVDFCILKQNDPNCYGRVKSVETKVNCEKTTKNDDCNYKNEFKKSSLDGNNHKFVESIKETLVDENKEELDKSNNKVSLLKTGEDQKRKYFDSQDVQNNKKERKDNVIEESLESFNVSENQKNSMEILTTSKTSSTNNKRQYRIENVTDVNTLTEKRFKEENRPIENEKQSLPTNREFISKEVKLVRYPRDPHCEILKPEQRGHICRPINYYQRREKPIGKGTFGEVYKGKDPEIQKDVALKKVLMENEVEGFPITALREVKIMKFIRHENILHLDYICQSEASDFNRNRGSIYMVFKWMDHDLAGLLKRDDIKFSLAQIKGYFKQLLEGLHHIHRHSIIHRDIKSSNILIDNTGVLKIADFGLARRIDTKRIQQGLTNRVVTLWYRPPELLLGETHYDTKIDMWGAGCILGEMFFKEEILKGENEMNQLIRIFQLCGTPNVSTWPGLLKLPQYNMLNLPVFPNKIKEKFKGICDNGIDLIEKCLCLNPCNRINAIDALDHDFFWIDPEPLIPSQMPKYSSSHEMMVRSVNHQKAIRQEMGSNSNSKNYPTVKPEFTNIPQNVVKHTQQSHYQHKDKFGSRPRENMNQSNFHSTQHHSRNFTSGSSLFKSSHSSHKHSENHYGHGFSKSSNYRGKMNQHIDSPNSRGLVYHNYTQNHGKKH